MTDLSPLSPPERLLCGPGPSNVHPRVLAAMRKPMVSHLDPAFHEMLESIVELLGAVYRRKDGMSIALSASGTSGMEAGIIALTEPGDTVIVASAGFFAARIADMAARHGARVIELTAPLGSTVDNDRILDELAHHPETKLVTVVHAETSTGACHPLAELAEAVSGTDALLMADCVTSLGGIELETGAWGVDYAFSCTQKCLGAPPGISPLSLSERALQRVQSRRAPMPFSFDLELLRRYWIERPAVYHHTMPILSYYALHEALRLALEEGLQERWERHAQAGAYLQAELRERGYELLAEPDVQLPQLTAVRVPEGIDGRAVQATLLAERGIEIGGGLGPSAPPIWRIGLMGTNATTDAADLVLEALDAAVPARALTGSAA